MTDTETPSTYHVETTLRIDIARARVTYAKLLKAHRTYTTQQECADAVRKLPDAHVVEQLVDQLLTDAGLRVDEDGVAVVPIEEE